MLDVGANQHQAVGAALAGGVGDAGLGAADLSLQHPLFLLLQLHEVFPTLQSARAKDAYIEREDRYAKQDPEECEHVEHGNMPAWAKDDPRTYWAASDDHERSNGRLYREVQFALPNELSPEARRDLARSFAEQLTDVKEGKLPYTLAFHKGESAKPDTPDNPRTRT